MFKCFNSLMIQSVSKKHQNCCPTVPEQLIYVFVYLSLNCDDNFAVTIFIIKITRYIVIYVVQLFRQTTYLKV
jgi:hypothetical protein